MRRPRHVSPEERALWDKVAARAEPLQGRPNRPPPARKQPPESAPNAPEAPRPVPQFRVGEAVDHSADHDLVAGMSEGIRSAPLRMDARTHGRMKRGKLSPQARLDLHGMTLSQAHPALVSFILAQHAAGKRLVLVITGKGRNSDPGGPIPVRHGQLRHQVPQWLHSPPLSHAVLQVTEAHRSHGGHGALYVYLRRAGR